MKQQQLLTLCGDPFLGVNVARLTHERRQVDAFRFRLQEALLQVDLLLLDDRLLFTFLSFPAKKQTTMLLLLMLL